MRKLARKKLSLSRATVLDLVAASGGAVKQTRGCETDGLCKNNTNWCTSEGTAKLAKPDKVQKLTGTYGNKQISVAGYYCPSEFPTGEYKACGGK